VTTARYETVAILRRVVFVLSVLGGLSLLAGCGGDSRAPGETGDSLAPVLFTVSDPGAVTLDSEALLTRLAPGNVEVRATYGPLEHTVSVGACSPGVDSFYIDPSSATIYAGIVGVSFSAIRCEDQGDRGRAQRASPGCVAA